LFGGGKVGVASVKVTARQAWRRLSGLAHALLEAIRAGLTYLSLVATVASSLALILKRDFAGAALTALSEAAEMFADVRRYADVIVTVWETNISGPVHLLLGTLFNVAFPLWAVEIATLLLFALGPVLRAAWTARALQGQVHQRLAHLRDLTAADVQQAKELRRQRVQRDDLDKAIRTKNWKQAQTILGTIVLGAAGVVSVLTFNLQQITKLWGGGYIVFQGDREKQSSLEPSVGRA
jgi:hypothetical protein